jgi:L-amino acid N-acyltransferase YncA
MWLFEKNWNKQFDFYIQEDPTVLCREAVPLDIEKIVESWPIEFAEIALDSVKCRELLHKRIAMSIPCFIAEQGDTLLAAVWCKPWSYDKAFTPDRQNRDAYEIVNFFTVEKARGKGVFGKLLPYVMEHMALKGYMVAYGRIMPERKASIRAFEKFGFKPLGLLTCGFILGHFFCRLDDSVRI